MSPETLKLKEEEILGKFPNSYTFTKNLAERALMKFRGNVPLLILRPAIVIATH